MAMLTLQGLALSIAGAIFLCYCICTIVRRCASQRPPSEKYNKRYKEKDILGILYQTGQQTLISFKDNQWSTTNYSLLGIAGIVAAFAFIHEAHIFDLWLKYIAVFSVLLIAGFGTVLVTDLQLGIRANRVAINQIKKILFPDKIAGYLGLSDSTIAKDKRFFRSAELLILFYASNIVGFGIALLIIAAK